MSLNSGEHLFIGRLLNIVTEANADITGLQHAAKLAASNPDGVISVLDACASGARLREISARAYWHANGFAKFTLVTAAPAGPLRIRLHVWLADEDGNQPGGDQNVHGHRWNFGSVVIAGPGLHIDEYVSGTGGGERYDAYAYRPTGSAAKGTADSELAPAGSALLEHSVSYQIGLRDTYACDVDKLHTVRPAPGPLTATLVMQGPALLAAAPVYRRPGNGPQAAPRAMTSGQARAVLAATVDAASTSGGA